jgi:hypothetical protein
MAGLAVAPPIFGTGPVTKGGVPHYTGPVPPRIPTVPGSSGFSGGMAALGLGAGAFSPWIGARLLNQSGIFKGLGGGGSGIAGQLFGAGGYGGFGVAYIGLQLASRALKDAFNELKDAVKRTATLYQEAASINRPATAIFQAQSAMRSIGLGDDAAKRYAKSGPAGLTSEEMMRITNMSGEFKKNFASAAMDAQIIANAGERSQALYSSVNNLTREFKTLWIAGINPVFKEIMDDLTRQLKLINIVLYEWRKLFGEKDKDQFSGLGGGQGMFKWTQFRQTSMERMGFTIGGNGVNALLQRSNYYLAIIANAARAGIGGTNFGGTPATNLP